MGKGQAREMFESESLEYGWGGTALPGGDDRYRSLFDQSMDAIVITRQGGEFIDANPAALALFGYPQDEMMRMDFQELYVNPGEGFRFQKEMKEKESLQGFKTRLHSKDRGEMDCLLDVACRRDGKGNIFVYQGIIRDITEALRAEKALRESKKNLEKAERMARMGNWRRDFNFDGGEWSPGMYRILGLPPGKGEGVSFKTFLSRVNPRDADHVISVLREAEKSKGDFEFEFRTIPIEGKERVIRVQGEVQLDDAGTPLRFFGTSQDITEIRSLYNQLYKSQKIEAIAGLAGGIAHEFNNALTPIIGHVELLEMVHDQDEMTVESLKAMKESGLRMTQLTGQLLSYAEGGKYHPVNLSLSEVVNVTLPFIRNTFKPHVHVEKDLSDVMNVEADKTQVQMLLSSILANANEAIENEGRIKIVVENRDVDGDFTKHHAGLEPGQYVSLTIEDDGKGMDEASIKKIFEPFFTTKFHGRGMGMAAVYGIVKNHGGWIHVDSELGEGTAVRIYLPAVKGGQVCC